MPQFLNSECIDIENTSVNLKYGSGFVMILRNIPVESENVVTVVQGHRGNEA